MYANLIAEVAVNDEAPTIDFYVIDGPASVQINPPRQSKTYGEYIGEVHEKTSGILKTKVCCTIGSIVPYNENYNYCSMR